MFFSNPNSPVHLITLKLTFGILNFYLSFFSNLHNQGNASLFFIITLLIYLTCSFRVVFQNVSNVRSLQNSYIKYFLIALSFNKLKFINIIKYSVYLLQLYVAEPIFYFFKNIYYSSRLTYWYPLFKKNSYYGYSRSIKNLNNFFKK